MGRSQREFPIDLQTDDNQGFSSRVQYIYISIKFTLPYVYSFYQFTVLLSFTNNIRQYLLTLRYNFGIDLSSTFFLIPNEVLVKLAQGWELAVNISCSVGLSILEKVVNWKPFIPVDQSLMKVILP